MTPDNFKYIQNLLKVHAGWDMSEDKLYILDRRLTILARQKNLSGIKELLEDIETKPKITSGELVEALAITDTTFNRDYDVFRRLEKVVLPQLKNAKKGSKRIRILSLGCSSGQEVYSMAMAINRIWGDEIYDWDIKIIGADINKKALNKAQRAKYSIFEVQQGMNIKDILANFKPIGEDWEVNNSVKKLVDFRECNIIDLMTFLDKFDLVACRNVLKYLCEEYKSDLLKKIHNFQPVGGLLYVGKNEDLSSITSGYKRINGFTCLYQSTSNAPEKNIEATNKDAIENGLEKDMPTFVRPEKL